MEIVDFKLLRNLLKFERFDILFVHSYEYSLTPILFKNRDILPSKFLLQIIFFLIFRYKYISL